MYSIDACGNGYFQNIVTTYLFLTLVEVVVQAIIIFFCKQPFRYVHLAALLDIKAKMVALKMNETVINITFTIFCAFQNYKQMPVIDKLEWFDDNIAAMEILSSHFDDVLFTIVLKI